MPRGEQALRQWKILTIIMNHSRYGVTQKEILDGISGMVLRGIGKRTFQRDLQILEQSGFPIDRSERNQEGQVLYKLLPTFQHIPPIMPATNELISLAVARSLLTMYNGTPFKEGLDSFWQKAQAIFPAEARKSLEEVQSMFGTLDRPAMDFSKYKGLMEKLNKAIKNRQQLAMTYYSQRQGKDCEYTINPVMIFAYGGFLHLAAFTPKYKEVRHYSLDRIKKVETTGLIFPHSAYSLETLKNDAFGMIREEPFELIVKFNKEIADYVKRRIHHPSQQFKDLPNGDTVMTIRAGGWDEMKSWVLSYSYQAEVLKPVEMREEIRKEVGKMLLNYEKR